ncbi:MAG TPA: hypothetical protein VFE05_12325 [Longimicrobiaceae bacterium]|nr:hypothetical protein [Longimicrobiaceae bacterium]
MTAPASPEERISAALAVLAAAGLPSAEVSVEGHEREIAAVRVPADAWEWMLGGEGTRAAAAIKALGFRYVAVDLLPAAS